MAPPKPVREVWELQSPADREAVWAVLSDTDRYNRAAGFGFTFEDVPHDDGTVTRRGTAKVFGLPLVWEELPFEYRRPEWYRIRRRFVSGPAAEYVVTLRLGERPGGTAIRYSIEVVPRNRLTRPLVAFELKKTRKPVAAALQAMLDRLVEPTLPAVVPPPPLTAEGRAALDDGARRLADGELAQRLRRFVGTAPLRDQERIHPLRLAREWQAAPERVVVSLLDAVDFGLLTLSLDLICPLCRGPKKRVGGLPRGRVTVHCTSCNVHYDGTYPDAVGVSFRTAPAVREFEVYPACLGSPANQPHVLAQDNLAPDGEATFAMPLEPGAYRIRTLPPRDAAALRVEVGAADHGAALDVDGRTLRPSQVVVAPGAVQVRLRNTSGAPVAVLLDRRALPADVLTVGRLLRLPGVLDRLPTAVLGPATAVQNVESALLAVETVGVEPGAVDPLEAWAAAAGARAYRYQPGRLVARFGSLEQVLALLKGADLPWMRAAVGDGVVAVVGDEADGLFVGEAVDDVVAALDAAGPGAVAALAASVAGAASPGWKSAGRVAVHGTLAVQRLVRAG